jgi:dTDP-4-dehydrorhamnose 3,5-epimerase
MGEGTLPHGVAWRKLAMNPDPRGFFAEVYRESWEPGVRPVQWSLALSQAGVLRGVHVHLVHDDYLIVPEGRVAIGLRDLRRGSPTEERSTLIEMRGDELTALVIPHGVAHGFYFLERSLFLNGASHYWDPTDDFACHWADPALGIPWPAREAMTSERDGAAPPLRDLLARLEAHQPIGA